MRVPSVAVEPCDILSYRDGRPPVQRRMGPMRIVEVLEGHQFVFQVRRRPEQQLIHAFSSPRADQPFDKRMRQRHIRHTLHLGHLQHPQVGAPLVKPIQRVVVGAEALRTREPSNRMVEHTAQGPAIHGSSMDATADDPPRVLVHHYQHPMASQDRRLAPEQVDAPQAILRMPQERQPGRTTRVGCRSIVRSEHSAHHVLVDVDRKGERDLLGDPRTAPPGVAPLHVDDGIDQCVGRSLGAGATALG